MKTPKTHKTNRPSLKTTSLKAPHPLPTPKTPHPQNQNQKIPKLNHKNLTAKHTQKLTLIKVSDKKDKNFFHLPIIKFKKPRNQIIYIFDITKKIHLLNNLFY